MAIAMNHAKLYLHNDYSSCQNSVNLQYTWIVKAIFSTLGTAWCEGCCGQPIFEHVPRSDHCIVGS